MRNQRVVGLLSCLLFAVAGCQEDASVSPQDFTQGDLRTLVAPSVAESLDSLGMFGSWSARSSGASAVITPDRARFLAVSYLQAYGAYRRELMEQLHGAPVLLEELVAEPRVLLSESPYEDAPNTTPLPFRKAFGSYYLVTVRDSKGSVAIVGVSALASDIELVDGKLIASGRHGNEFRTWYVNASGTNQPTLSPESAVRLAHARFGRTIAEVPRLVRKGPTYGPQLASWQIRLTSDVRVRTSSSTDIATNVVYVDAGTGQLSVSSEVQSPFVARFRSAERARFEVVTLKPRSDVAASLTRLQPTPR